MWQFLCSFVLVCTMLYLLNSSLELCLFIRICAWWAVWVHSGLLWTPAHTILHRTKGKRQEVVFSTWGQSPKFISRCPPRWKKSPDPSWRENFKAGGMGSGGRGPQPMGMPVSRGRGGVNLGQTSTTGLGEGKAVRYKRGLPWGYKHAVLCNNTEPSANQLNNYLVQYNICSLFKG